MCAPSTGAGVNISMPTYSGSLKDSLKAQVNLLRGGGDFSDIGPLQNVLEQYERPLRMSQAQTNTDVLRQTLLGDRTPTYAIQQPTTAGQADQDTQRRAKTQIDYGGPVEGDGRVRVGDGELPEGLADVQRVYESSNPRDSVINAAVKAHEVGLMSRSEVQEVIIERTMEGTTSKFNNWYDSIRVPEGVYKKNSDIQGADAAFEKYVADGGDLDREAWNNQDFVVPRDESGNFILEADNTTEIPGGGQPVGGGGSGGQQPVSGGGQPTGDIDFTRSGTGLVDLLGDKRLTPEGRLAGFADAEGNEFLGLAALAEDIQQGNLSRQREADLADVERLSDRYRDVMADYKPESKSGLDTSRALLDQYFTRMTGMRKATQDDVNRGLATEVGEVFTPMTDRQRIEQSTTAGQSIGRRLGLREQAQPEMMGPNPLGQPQPGEVVQQPTSLDPITTPSELQASDYAFTGDAAIGQLESGENTLRSALLGQARSALDAGLSDREMAQVQDAARARQTMMGRTFDQKGAIEEAEARVMEDNQRRMQNRAFAQSQLGQEAGLQTGDVTRAMTTDQFNVGAKMDAERLNEQLRQSGLGNYINAVRGLASLEDQYMLDPFQAILGRVGGGSFQSGQSALGQASYGLDSSPSFINPESGLGYISQMAANNANMYGAQLSADASRSSGLMSGLGNLVGSGVGAFAAFCWVAREVYGPANPAWLQFREWMFTESPDWFFNLYKNYGERFASFISDKPRIKSIIRKWMDSKIGGK